MEFFAHLTTFQFLAVSASIRKTAEDTTVDTKHNPPVATHYLEVTPPTTTTSGTVMPPCIWNEIISIPWNAAGKAALVATPQLHVNLMEEKGDTVAGTITLPLATITSHVAQMSGPTWLPLSTAGSIKYGVGENVRLNVAWQFFPSTPRNDQQEALSSAFDKLTVGPLNFDPPMVQPGELKVLFKNIWSGIYANSDVFFWIIFGVYFLDYFFDATRKIVRQSSGG